MTQIISIQDHKRKDCKHPSILVDEDMRYIECADCHEKLNPIYWLKRRAVEEANEKWVLLELQKQVKKTENKVRMKCRFCGQFNSIRA